MMTPFFRLCAGRQMGQQGARGDGAEELPAIHDTLRLLLCILK